MSEYNSKHIHVLDDLAAVRTRPGMYIADTSNDGIIQLARELFDNSLDELIAGYCNTIEVTIDPVQGWIKIGDNGRGIPVDTHADFGVSAATILMTNLHSGGKFGKEGSAYKVSGGLHGVGLTVVNFLSLDTVLEVWRDGFHWKQVFHQGRPVADIHRLEASSLKGTEVKFSPDPEIFHSVSWPRITATLTQHLIYVSKMLQGKTVRLSLDGGVTYKDLDSTGGLRSILEDWIKPEERGPFSWFEHDGDQCRVCIAWSKKDSVSFVNLVPTVDHGVHLLGVQDALEEVISEFVKIAVPNTYYWSSIGVLAWVEQPEFKSQMKTRLQSRGVRNAIKTELVPALRAFFHKNTRLVAALQQEFEKHLPKPVEEEDKGNKKKVVLGDYDLPPKLACADDSCPASMRELYLVEGDSAGGSAKKARSKRFQEVLTLKGKILNTQRAGGSRARGNDEIESIARAIGGGFEDDFSLERCRYSKIILLMDADADGAHINTLAIALLMNYFWPLFYDKSGSRIYVVDSPLFIGENKKGEQLFGYTPEDMTAKGAVKIQRLKGQGSANADVLKEYAMDPATRRIRQITPDDAAYATLEQLMGQGSAFRKQLLYGSESEEESAEADV